MKKGGAIAILTVMLTGLLAWGGTSIIDHGERISVNETKLELLQEVRDDVKTLLLRTKE